MNEKTKFKVLILLIIVGLLLSHFLLARSAFIAGGMKVCRNMGNMVLIEDFKCKEREQQSITPPIPTTEFNLSIKL